MSYHLACNLSSKFAAVISVTGSMSSETFQDCNPAHPTAIMQIHGQLDGTVPYEGNSSLGMTGVEDVLNYWGNYNSCGEPTTSTADYFDQNSSVDHMIYSGCSNNVQVELYKISNMGHTWPGAGRAWPDTDRFGISASDKIWSFINMYDVNGKIN
jgi:polyhydroxybutyrate depolymerase